MSEQQQDKLNNVAPEAVEDMTAEKETVSAEVKKPVKKAKKGSKGKKRKNKKKRGVPVVIVIVLIVVVILLATFFGIVLGYGLGRNTSSGRLEKATEQIDELTDLIAENNGQEVDIFTEELSPENAHALDVLSGEVKTGEESSQADAMMSGEAFGGVEENVAEEIVVAEFNGGKLTSTEVSAEYNQRMTGYIFAGFSEEEVAANLLSEVMEDMVAERILRSRADKLGLLELTSADKDQIETEAKASYAEQVDYYRSNVREDGMSEEQLTKAAEAFLLETEGVTYDTVYADLESGWWANKLYNHVVENVEVASADILALYQERLADQKANFTAYADDFEYAQKNGDTIVYNLPGYRAVKMLLLGFEDEAVGMAAYALEEELETLDPQTDIERISEINNQINAFYATPEAQAKAVLDQLAAGKDFDTLLDEYGTDAGMKNPALRETGYYVSADSVLWHKNFIDAAMALQNPGDVSGAVRVGEGVCILSYVGEVAEGEVPMSKVTDALTQECLQNAQLVAYEAQLEQWLSDANVKYYPERMQ